MKRLWLAAAAASLVTGIAAAETFSFAWSPPELTFEDGAPVPAGALVRYRIYLKGPGDSVKRFVTTVTNPSTNRPATTPGTYCYHVTTWIDVDADNVVDISEDLSVLSEESSASTPDICFTIAAPVVQRRPRPPTNVHKVAPTP